MATAKKTKAKKPKPTEREVMLARNAARDELQTLADRLSGALAQGHIVSPIISQIVALSEVPDG